MLHVTSFFRFSLNFTSLALRSRLYSSVSSSLVVFMSATAARFLHDAVACFRAQKLMALQLCEWLGRVLNGPVGHSVTLCWRVFVPCGQRTLSVIHSWLLFFFLLFCKWINFHILSSQHSTTTFTNRAGNVE